MNKAQRQKSVHRSWSGGRETGDVVDVDPHILRCLISTPNVTFLSFLGAKSVNFRPENEQRIDAIPFVHPRAFSGKKIVDLWSLFDSKFQTNSGL